MSFESLLAISLVAGFVGGMSGMGGEVVLIPAITYHGMDIKHAIGVHIVSVIATPQRCGFGLPARSQEDAGFGAGGVLKLDWGKRIRVKAPESGVRAKDVRAKA